MCVCVLMLMCVPLTGTICMTICAHVCMSTHVLQQPCYPLDLCRIETHFDSSFALLFTPLFLSSPQHFLYSLLLPSPQTSLSFSGSLHNHLIFLSWTHCQASLFHRACVYVCTHCMCLSQLCMLMCVV